MNRSLRHSKEPGFLISPSIPRNLSCVFDCEDLLLIYFFIPLFKYVKFIYSSSKPLRLAKIHGKTKNDDMTPAAAAATASPSPDQSMSTQYGLRSLKFAGFRFWNSQPTNISNLNSLKLFCKAPENSMLSPYTKNIHLSTYREEILFIKKQYSVILCLIIF